MIDSIIPSGEKPVYDLANLTPHPNFFANGFLAHNCYWGRGGTTTKYRYHALERVHAEINWAARNNVRYIFNADSNFGMHKRDSEIVDMLIASKQQYGYPDKFRTCWGKNTDARIFMLAAKLHKFNMEKGITLARQSNTKAVLANIKRGNIKLESYTSLQRRFNDLDVPVYTEMILGLPGETYESWRSGINQILSSGLRNQLFVYQCEVYPNTEMGEPEYQKKFGIITKRIELREIHGSIRDDAWIKEYQDIIIESQTMPNSDWRRMTKLAVTTMLLHSMKLGFYILGWLADMFGRPYIEFIEFTNSQNCNSEEYPILASQMIYLDEYLDKIMNGQGRGCILPGYLDIYWDIEEALFIHACEKMDSYYREMERLIEKYLASIGAEHDHSLLSEIIAYQNLRIPRFADAVPKTHIFQNNIPEYFDYLFSTQPIKISHDVQIMMITPIDFSSDRQRFVRETILWGRKSGTLLVKYHWKSLNRPEISSDLIEADRAIKASEILANWPAGGQSGNESDMPRMRQSV